MKKKEPHTIYQKKRKEAEISQEKAAENFGMSARNLQYIESGRREPKASVLFRMAELYRCSVLEFEPEAKKAEEKKRQKKGEEELV